MNMDYTLWPNFSEELGKVKIEIPDGITTPWPEGDVLIGNFIYKNGKLNGFVDTKALIINKVKSTTFNYNYVDISTPSIEEKSMTFIPGEQCKKCIINGVDITPSFKYKNCKNLFDIYCVDYDYLTNDRIDGNWTESLADLKNGDVMFVRNPDGLKSFSSDLSNLESGKNMFRSCNSMTSFDCDLPKLTVGEYMFYACHKLENLHILNLSNLVNGISMFCACYSLPIFEIDMPSLKNGTYMFQNCTSLTSFHGDLSNLTRGYYMFEGCTSLTSFRGDLSNLTDGSYMFYECKLDTASVQNIADTINNANSKFIQIGIGNSTPNDQETAAFNTIASKGWIVYVNGDRYTPSSVSSIMTLDELSNEVETPIPFYAKPVPSTEETANYIDSEGNFFNIAGAQFIYGDDLSTYGMFTCEEDAATNMGLTKIEKPSIIPSFKKS